MSIEAHQARGPRVYVDFVRAQGKSRALLCMSNVRGIDPLDSEMEQLSFVLIEGDDRWRDVFGVLMEQSFPDADPVSVEINDRRLLVTHEVGLELGAALSLVMTEFDIGELLEQYPPFIGRVC